jgi:serine/threonine protein kinase
MSAIVARLGALFVDMSEFDVEPTPFATGSYGYIFRATHSRTHREVAVKRMYPLLSRTPDGCLTPRADPMEIFGSVRSFFREVILQTAAGHPAILQLVGWSIHRARVEIVVQPSPELVAHDTVELVLISDMMKATLDVRDSGLLHPLSPTELQIIIYGVARAMSYLHAMRIIHRDLKPENVFVDSEMRPRVGDLGGAKVTNGESSHSIAFGTPLYLAPEIWMTGTHYSLPADVYSYATTIYAFLDGRVPVDPAKQHRINDPQDLGYEVASGNRPPFKKTPPKYRAMIRKLWAQDPRKRRTFAWVENQLIKPDYAIDGADQDAFRAYKRHLDSQCRAAGEARPADWLNELKTDVEIRGPTKQEILMTSELGNEHAQMACALLYLNGHMGPVNLYESAIRARDIIGQAQFTMLNTIFENESDLQRGIIAEIEGKDDDAAERYRKAALAGEKEAILRYAALLLKHGQQEDGLGLFRMLADAGDIAANYNLAEFYLTMEYNEPMAMHYLAKCCEMRTSGNFPEAHYLYGQLLVKAGQYDEGLMYLRRADTVYEQLGCESDMLSQLIRSVEKRLRDLTEAAE